MQRQVIEHGGLAVGIAVPHGDGLRFIAVKFHVIDLDNLQFASVADLQEAIRAHLLSRPALAA